MRLLAELDLIRSYSHVFPTKYSNVLGRLAIVQAKAGTEVEEAERYMRDTEELVG